MVGFQREKNCDSGSVSTKEELCKRCGSIKKTIVLELGFQLKKKISGRVSTREELSKRCGFINKRIVIEVGIQRDENCDRGRVSTR